MSNRGQPNSTYRARRQRGKRPSESFAQQPEPVVRAEHEDLVVDTAAIDRHRVLLARALQRHANAGRNGPLFLDPFDPSARRFYLDD
ncbi:hypothetical protein [Dietzia maris]|uniref:hypothetical protein n=1 Tax=Dietzia maris TaxID=37915 RepID=UPI0037CB1EFE